VSAALIHELLQRAVAAHPDHTAVADSGRTLTYDELDQATSRLAHALLDCGVQPGDRVGLLLEKSLEAVIGVYGILKAGCAYVPLDERSPASRLAGITSDAGIRCLVTERVRAHDWEAMIAGGASLDTLIVAGETASTDARTRVVPWSSLDDYPAQVPETRASGDMLSYILYTSGSTGVPKGVMHSHSSALAFVEWAAAEIGVGPEDRLSSHAPFHFDLSTFDLFAAAAASAAVVLVPREASVFPRELARFIREAGITVWYSVPSALSMLATRGGLAEEGLDELRAVLFAGEVFPTKYLRQLMELVPRARFYNLYGPTETNVCTWYEVPRGERTGPDPIPIGRPIPGDDVRVVDEDGGSVPAGATGELLVHGATVMLGYWGDPERTALVLETAGGERIYRTGDLVSEASDGNLMFVGRRDAQVKSRGYRIELGEIENALHAHDQVAECAVVAIPDELVTNRLKAFVVPREGLAAPEIMHWCRERLPPQMVPDEVELCTELPRSSTGKIDRRHLG
jgi:amino acid adenylation domain-containing protein